MNTASLSSSLSRKSKIAVREAAGYSSEKIGVDLMRQAFGNQGPLRDSRAHGPEEDALCHLFAGVIGYCKESEQSQGGRADSPGSR